MSIKVLHTADWHIGKQLMKIDFSDDMELFFDWLVEVIREDKIDVLLMSGDLFDQANPSQQAMRHYYLFLKRMISIDCKVIITGGNHDSPQVLNAPKELLEILQVSVVGGCTNDVASVFIPVEKNGQKIVVAAVPYLRDKDIRQGISGESYDDKIQQVKEGLGGYFTSIDTYYESHFKGVPFILMAHLYAQGVESSDSEREIQIGNQAAINATIFGDNFSYVALGHIHRPQKVGSDYIRYSGSPIPMSFSEKTDKKQVVILEIKDDKLTFYVKEIPSFRKLITLKGSISKVKEKLENHNSTSPLSDLVELQILEENESSEHIYALEELLASDGAYKVQILKGKIEFINKVKGTGSFLNNNEDINDYTPVQLFEKRMVQDESIENPTEFINAFKEILEEMSQQNPNSSTKL